MLAYTHANKVLPFLEPVLELSAALLTHYKTPQGTRCPFSSTSRSFFRAAWHHLCASFELAFVYRQRVLDLRLVLMQKLLVVGWKGCPCFRHH